MGGVMGGAMGGGGGQQYPGGGMMRYPGMMSQMGGVRPAMGQVIGQRMIQPYAQRPSMYEEVQSVTTIPNPSFPRAPGNAVPPYLPANAGVQNPPGKPSVPSPYSTVSMSPGPPIAQGSPSSLVGHTHLPVAQVRCFRFSSHECIHLLQWLLSFTLVTTLATVVTLVIIMLP